MGKQMEGGNEERRRRAKQPRDADTAPSAEGVTTGASTQQRHLGNEADHPEKITGAGWGKADPDRVTGTAKPGGVPTPKPEPTQTDAMPSRHGRSRAEPGELSEDERRVFDAIVRLEMERDEPPTASDVTHVIDLSTEETVDALQRLMDDHDVVQELRTEPTFGPRYRVKARV